MSLMAGERATWWDMNCARISTPSIGELTRTPATTAGRRAAGQPVFSVRYSPPGDTASLTAFSVTVPSRRLRLLDDHRSVAVDGRYQLSTPDNGAFVPIANVVGIYLH